MLSSDYASQLSTLGTLVSPSPLKGMKLTAVNRELATSLQLPDSWWHENKLTHTLSDPDSPVSQQAFAQKYGGHQFGHWNPQLGDGRGLLLGETRDLHNQPVDLHLKGAGPTPYSRGADGRAVLRSTIREYIGSEALHALGIPTSRALCLFTSDETVYREQPEPGAMMIRTAPSHIRFGHFEYFYHAGQHQELTALFDYTLQRYFPECINTPSPFESMFKSIVTRTARMISLWQAYGFVHGVMNTDNFSIHGITFDYGPYAFLDAFKPDAVFNHSDYQHRYAFDRQPGIALWNLQALATAFSVHLSNETLANCLNQFEPVLVQQYQQLLLKRFGFEQVTQAGLEVAFEWLELLAEENADYSYLFRQLTLAVVNQDRTRVDDIVINRPRFEKWWQTFSNEMEKNHSKETMLKANPAILPRTHILQEIIKQAEEDNWQPFNTFLDMLCDPFSSEYDQHEWAQPPKQKHAVSLSCSS